MRRGIPILSDGWVCPKCGQHGRRHGRGGARACKGNRGGKECPGLVCVCLDGMCFDRTWRRSPCTHAVCNHCGWEGTVRNRAFEVSYGASRCHRSSTGWHYCTMEIDRNETPGALRIRVRCQLCGRSGALLVDASDIDWNDKEGGGE